MKKSSNVVKILFEEEKKAYKLKEVPVGVVIVLNDRIIATAHNMREKKKSVLKHAELIALEKASKKMKTWKLNDCILYTTLFPCPMCAAAIQQSRIKKIIYVNDTKNNESRLISINILNNIKLNHRVEIEKINIETDLLKKFFKNLRN